MTNFLLPRTVSSPGFAIYLFALSLVLALLEIEIEGRDGWAAALPTWRFQPPWLLRLTSGKALTGYHVWLNTLLLLWLHVPFWFVAWDWRAELALAGAYFLMAVQWDFLWFVLNPHFGLARFSRANVPWFRTWILGVPSDYYCGLALSLVCWMAAGIHVTRWAKCAGVLAGLTVISILWARKTEPRP